MDAAYFDSWYEGMASSPRRDAIVQAALGLPARMESSSLLPWSGIADVIDLLALRPDETFLDLACGRGGYGIEIARRTGVRLVGIDFSPVAIARAAANCDVPAARFAVGDLTASGLEADSVDAVLCVDAMQFADPYEAGVAELHRVLRAGGRCALTGWEALDPTDTAVPERLCRDVGAALRVAGFVDVVVHEQPAWRAAERAQWEAAVLAEPDGDPAVESLRREGERVLPWLDRSRRVVAVARV